MSQGHALRSTSREKLFHALYEAAELEQNLMCTYLYAAFSLKDGESDGLSPAEAEAVARWRRVILDVAIEEMSHLVAVWNITAALGGAPRFGRTNFPLMPGYLPAGITLKLAPFGADVLQHFIFLERPEQSDEVDGEGFVPINGATRTPIAPRLTPAAFDYATIGSFYHAIETGLCTLVDTHGEAVVFCGDPALQLSPDVTTLAGATRIASLDAALAALAEIIVEGEGAPSDRANSHFQRFCGVREELRILKAENPLFAPAHPAAVSPVLRKPPEAAGRVWLEGTDAIAAVDLANAIYALSLRLIAGAYELANSSPDKSLYVGCAIALMHALGAIAERAARLPAGKSNPHCNAGVTFTALREAAALPPGASARQIYLERIEELHAVAATLDPTDPRCACAARILEAQADRFRAAASPASTRKLPASPSSNQVTVSAAPVQPDTQNPSEGHTVMVHFDGSRCIHARVCVTQAPGTFLANVDGPWIIADATDPEQLCGTIRQCPSGALSYERHGDAPEPVPPVNLVTLRENGPYAVRADLLLAGTRVGYRATLCRCGASKNKPFCDKSHNRVGFIATGEPPSLETPLLAHRGGPLAIETEDDGPLHVTGNLEILSGTGRAVACIRNTRLCRCGGSANKPFCDGTHRRIGFQS